MVAWNNLDTLKSFNDLKATTKVNLVDAMAGEGGAARVKSYSVPMAEGMVYNYASKQVDDSILDSHYVENTVNNSSYCKWAVSTAAKYTGQGNIRCSPR